MTPADERPHGGGPESWWFDFAAVDGALAGFVRLVLGAGAPAGAAWFWAALVGDGRPYLLVRDEDVPAPRPGATEVRAEGLWSSLECEDPFDHWTIGLEAFAVSLDDPDDAWHGERGDIIGLGFDLEWEATEPAAPFPVLGSQTPEIASSGTAERYGQACVVHGDILVGPTERITFEGTGWRSHTWGQPCQPVPAAGAAGTVVRQRAPLVAGGRPVEYVLVGPATSGTGGGWRARDPGS